MVEIKKTKIKAKNLAQSPLKLRLVADMVRGMNVQKALDLLRFTNKKGAIFVTKALKSAVSSAEEKFEGSPEKLIITHISVDEAPTLKRYRFASRARVNKINKRRSNLNLEVSMSK
ncbi:50S ribosomal protein L22 [Candidatus Nomurabacteria bacterium]|uniref:Large ribosomal subunit protein uL22 n=1 Tax=Candidatus Dojkabacteria bacterium TaxID=2099670 RepID=A0A955I2N5_9BACT|nr:50S ribosomal protein L22 [Candidatus Dojkabacteria bacterium]MCB9789416.1 50S ribosomal protein L22 [Candidatus Nomurabacteria bacterium]MCB9803738.1 50S ribosomal protein L22 [Candidatus Nomurabacteria bacterium]